MNRKMDSLAIKFLILAFVAEAISSWPFYALGDALFIVGISLAIWSRIEPRKEMS